jgi:hypothetical protein
MEEALRFFRTYEIWIYLILGLGGFYYLRKFILAWQELRGAAFGLERDSAQARLNAAASILVLLLTIVVIEFVLVSFIAPAIPGAVPLLTPTLDLLATSTVTLPAPAAITTGTPEPAAAGTEAGFPTPGANATPAVVEGCVPGQIAITHPQEGQEISDSVDITGTVNIPNFGFYKFEMKLQDAADWQTLLAGNEPRQEALLGTWNTALLPPGNYQLGLVVTDNQGKNLPACIVNVRIAPPQDVPQP